MAAFDDDGAKAVDVVLADKRMGIARLTGMQGVDFCKHIIEGGMNRDHRIHAGFIFDLLEALGRSDIGLDHRLHVGEHLNAALHEIHGCTADHAGEMALIGVLHRENDR